MKWLTKHRTQSDLNRMFYKLKFHLNSDFSKYLGIPT